MIRFLAENGPTDDQLNNIIGWLLGGFVIAWIAIFLVKMLVDFWKDRD